MIKPLTLSLLLTFIILNGAKAQTSPIDSVKKIAIKDAKKFKLGGIEIRNVKKGTITDKSDLFKPTIESTSKTTLLSDSTYVKAYREATYQRTLKSRSSAHYILLGVEITAGLLLGVSLIALGVASK